MPEVPSDQAKDMPRTPEFSSRPPRMEIKDVLAGTVDRFNSQQAVLRVDRREKITSLSRAEALLSGHSTLSTGELSEIANAVASIDSTTPSAKVDQQYAGAETARLVQELQTVLAQRQILAEKAVQDWLVQVYVESVRGVMHSSNGTPDVVTAVEEFEATGKVFNFPLPEPLRRFIEQLPKKLAAVFVALLITACTVQPASAEQPSTASTIESLERDASVVGDDLEQRPTATPTRPTPTSTAVRVAQAQPTPTPRPTAVPTAEAPVITEQEMSVQLAIISGSGINIRKGPGTETAILESAVVTGRQFVLVLGENGLPVVNEPGGDWYQIRPKAEDRLTTTWTEGWVHRTLFNIAPGKEIVASAGPNTGGQIGAAEQEVVTQQIAENTFSPFLEIFSGSEVSRAESEVSYPEAMTILTPSLRLLNTLVPESDRAVNTNQIRTAVIDGELYAKMGNSIIKWEDENLDPQLHAWYVIQQNISSPDFQVLVSSNINPDIAGEEPGTGYNPSVERSQYLAMVYQDTARDDDGNPVTLLGIEPSSPKSLESNTDPDWLSAYLLTPGQEDLYNDMLVWAKENDVLAEDGPFADAVTTQDRLTVLFQLVQERLPNVKSIHVHIGSVLSPDIGWYSSSGSVQKSGMFPRDYFSFDNGKLHVYVSPTRSNNTNLGNGILAALSSVSIDNSSIPISSDEIVQPESPTALPFLRTLKSAAFVEGEIDGIAGIYPIFTTSEEK